MASFEFYQQRANQFLQQTEQVEKIIRQHAWSRIALVLIGGTISYLAFTTTALFYFVPVILFAFFFVVKRQAKQEEKKQLLLNLIRLNQAEAKAVNFDYDEFSNGSRFADPHHPFGYDLDLFGKGSLFQYLNRCATQLGEERLAQDIAQLSFDATAIKQRQEAVRELGTFMELRQQAWALGRQIKDFEFDRRPLEKWLTEPPLIYKNKINTILKWVLPAIAIGFVVMTVIDFAYYPLVLIMTLIQLAIAGSKAKKILQLQNTLARGKTIMENYAKVFALLQQERVTSSLMKQHHQQAAEASDAVRQFAALVNSLESRMNPIAMMFGNGLFLYDFHAVSKLEQWREQNGSKLPSWLESLAEWDALISLGTLHYNHPEYAFGEITDELAIEGKQVGHPLIPASSCVKNDLNLGNPAGIMLITGANMAGKSTFLRTIGVNYILAHCGAPVCASQWKSPIIELRSGMRTSDSLQDHQSYFYAELHRLQSIMQELRAGKRILILLDEILKGTNSTDKQLGSRELLKQLKEYPALVLLATHDIALGDLQENYPTQIVNTCFEGRIEDGHLSFDYKLNYGVAQKANATFLMRQMGIIKSDS